MKKTSIDVDYSRNGAEETVAIFSRNEGDGTVTVFGELRGEIAEYVVARLSRADALAEAAHNYRRAQYLLRKAQYLYQLPRWARQKKKRRRCSFFSVARAIDLLEEYDEELANALAAYREE